MTLSTHVLNAGTGRPAAGVAVLLEQAAPWQRVEEDRTGADGRLRFAATLEPGGYRITFATGPYFAALGTQTFYPEVTVTFAVTSGTEHYHVPLLLSPFAYSTYRGS